MNKLPTHKHRVPGAISVIATLMLALGCSGPSEPDDAGTDVPSDAEPPVLDSEVPPPDSGLAPECETGERRTADCGFCGMESQSCEDPGVWMATSECLGQGECEVGEVETREGALCQQEQRICLDGCAWSDWEETRPAATCEPGDTRRAMSDTCGPSERLLEECSDACEWVEDVGTCVDACGGAPARTSPEWAREVCVPDGPFVRGRDGTIASPEATIQVSSFYIDVYPVTNRRYQQCVAAGACAAPSGEYARTDSTYADYPVQGIRRSDAVDFCAWDGGRRFVTLAEWEKAARGPAPREPRYPWGEDLDCAIVDAGQAPCYAWSGSHDGLALDPYDVFPSTAASYYGVQMMGFGVREWAQDRWCGESWRASPAGMSPDPVCRDSDVPSDAWFMQAGRTRHQVIEVYRASAWQPEVADSHSSIGVRCGRPG
ncbi:MAG: SUMF1/EgtB/PvdO family nonheme iron enzyme [Sandaracinaceae bacterium]